MSDTMRARLAAKIAEQDAARGRPLTDVERLENLAAALSVPPYKRWRHPPGCPDPDWCSGNGACWWNCQERGE